MESLKVSVFPCGPFVVNTLLVWDPKSKEAFVVDPGERAAVEELAEFADRKGLNVKFIINTHEHPDHTAANAWAKLTWPRAQLLMHPLAAEDLNFWTESEIGMMAGAEYSPQPDSLIKDGDSFSLGEFEFKVIHAPGHSPGSVVLYSPTGNLAIVGDLIFKGSIGRYDLPKSNFQELKRSILRVLEEVDRSAVVVPGHGEATTLAAELEGNPFVRDLLR